MLHCVSPEKLKHTSSDVLGWASSPEPTEPSLFKPKPSRALTRACSGLGLDSIYYKNDPPFPVNIDSS